MALRREGKRKGRVSGQERLAVKKGDGKTLAEEVERKGTEKERCNVNVDSEGVVTECTGGMQCNRGSLAPCCAHR